MEFTQEQGKVREMQLFDELYCLRHVRRLSQWNERMWASLRRRTSQLTNLPSECWFWKTPSTQRNIQEKSYWTCIQLKVMSCWEKQDRSSLSDCCNVVFHRYVTIFMRKWEDLEDFAKVDFVVGNCVQPHTNERRDNQANVRYNCNWSTLLELYRYVRCCTVGRFRRDKNSTFLFNN